MFPRFVWVHTSHTLWKTNHENICSDCVALALDLSQVTCPCRAGPISPSLTSQGGQQWWTVVASKTHQVEHLVMDIGQIGWAVHALTTGGCIALTLYIVIIHCLYGGDGGKSGMTPWWLCRLPNPRVREIQITISGKFTFGIHQKYSSEKNRNMQ